MPGIVTSTGGSGSVRTYRMAFTATSTSVAINFVTGTTSGSSAVCAPADKGVYVVFQNQSTSANITIGGPDVTVNTQGIVLGVVSATNPSQYAVFSAGSFTSIQMTDWWVCTTSSLGAAVAQLVHGV